MARLPHLRLIIDTEPQSGAWNMAVDETLLETAISTGVATLRWYQWCEATVSLGYFQSSADFLNDRNLSRLPSVRRLTGGGAIIHDDELTYSIALPLSQKLFARPPQLYNIVHQSLIAGLQELGIAVTSRGETVHRPDEPLLCFQRQDAHDLVVGGFKVLGSAQRRRCGAILQHGSLIRRGSAFAPELPGFADIASISVPDDLERILATRLAETIADSWTLQSLNENERETARRLCDENRTKVRDR